MKFPPFGFQIVGGRKTSLKNDLPGRERVWEGFKERENFQGSENEVGVKQWLKRELVEEIAWGKKIDSIRELAMARHIFLRDTR